MMKEAEAHKEEDNKKKESADTKNDAEQVIFMTEKALKDLGDKVTDKDKKEAEKLIDKTKKALEGEDLEDIKKAKDELLTKAEITIEALKQEIYELKNKYAMAYADTENLKKMLTHKMMLWQ